MTNETVFLGGCPVVRPEGIYVDGHRVIRLGLHGVGLGDVGDLLAYRQEWEPFISAHIDLWRNMRDLLEQRPEANECPPGIFDPSQIKTHTSFCASLGLMRLRANDILTRWNVWHDKSSADMVAGADVFLAWHQETVMLVGDDYTKELLDLSKMWNIPAPLPELPSFSAQQELRARIEGAYITAKGVIQLIGYSAGNLLGKASDLTNAVAQGLTDGAKAIPKALNWALIVGAAAVAVVGGALVIYYVPRRSAPAELPPRPI